MPRRPINALGTSGVQRNFIVSAERTARRVEARHDENDVLLAKVSHYIVT